MATGMVKWFIPEKGYGFIQPDGGGPDVFVHSSAIPGTGIKHLEEGMSVVYDVVQGAKGPVAENVVRRV